MVLLDETELKGILEAILISSTSSIVDIYTDSQVTIQSIQAVEKTNTQDSDIKLKI
ncbi:2922_t:CDS:1, partial [Gigaspora margarita]